MRPALKTVAVNGALILALLVATELVFGSWIRGPAYSVLNIPRNTIRHFDVSRLYPGHGPAVYSRDEHGLRGAYSDPGKIDILVMGGSTADEIYVSDELTWVEQLRKAFAAAGQPLVIVNAAIDGQSSIGHIRAIDIWFPNIPGLRTRYVLFYIGINDIAVNPKSISQFDAMKSPEPLRRVRYYLMNNSIFYNKFRQVRGMFTAWRMQYLHGVLQSEKTEWRPATTGPGEEDLAKTLEPRLTAYAARLQTLVRKVRTDLRAEPIFVTQKRGDYRIADGRLLVRVDKGAATPSDEAHRTLRAFNQVTLAVAAEMKAPAIDLARGLAFEEGDFYDHIHTTPAGSRRIGRFIYEEIKDRVR
jgi:lysophospholipase L1-like esterase